MSVIDEVKQRIDIVEVIGQYASLKKAGRNLTALCPFHSEKHASFFVYPEQQSWHCFGACGTGGDVFSFIMKKENISFGDALRLLAQRAGVTIPSKFEPDDKKGEKESLYEINEAAAQYFHNLLLNSKAAEKVRNYLASRGLTQKTIADFQLGFSLDSWESLKPYLMEKGYSENMLLGSGLLVQAENGKTHDRFRGRLIIPIRDARGHTTGFGARVLDDSLPKYMNSPQTLVFDKSSTLYGIDLAAAAIRQQDQSIIVEGYLDVIIAHQYGIANVVASMGTSVTEQQVGTLKKLTRNLVLALDADAAGEEAMLRGVKYENTLDSELKVVILPQGKDPDEVIKEDIGIWRKLVAEAVPIVDYTFNIVSSKLDLTEARGKSLAVEKLLPIILEIKDSVRQTHYMQKLARLVKVSERSLEAAAGKMKSASTPGKYRVKEPKQTITHALRPYMHNPLEEDCLALLLQHYELKGNLGGLCPEHFQNSENREIFIGWLQADASSSLKEIIDSAIHEHIDSLMSKSLPSTDVEQRLADYSRRLHERFLRSLEAKRAEVFALEAETGGTGADLAKLEAEGIEPSIKLKEIFIQRNQRRLESRR